MAFFVVKKNPERPGTLRVVLGKSVAKKTVTRNLLKRRIKAAIRPVIGRSSPGFVIIVRPGAASLTYDELRREIVQKIK